MSRYNGYNSANVYTDGACQRNGRSGARAGIGVYWGENNPNNVSEPVSGSRHTNNAAEIEAATRAINQARSMGYDRVTVNTDSEFLVNSATKWMPRWENNGWRTIDDRPVKNQSELRELKQAMSGGTYVEFQKVPAHQGNRGNNEADRLARQGAYKN